MVQNLRDTNLQSFELTRIASDFFSPNVLFKVNSDVIYSKAMKNGSKVIQHIDKTQVGTLIVTKEVGSNKMKNITEYYKFPEGNYVANLNKKPFIYITLTLPLYLFPSFSQSSLKSPRVLSHCSSLKNNENHESIS